MAAVLEGMIEVLIMVAEGRDFLMHARIGECERLSDRSDAACPILARMLATRRDNLKNTITALERRLSKLDQAELVAEPA